MPRLLLLSIVIFLSYSSLFAQNCAVNAGTDQTICVTSALTLTGVAGNPQSAPPLFQWTKLSGPSATITSPNALTTTVTGFTPGNYVFELSNRCSDNLLAKDIIVVTVLPEPPTAIAGPDITQCTNTPAVALNANAVTTPNIGTWSVLPSGGSFSPNVNAPNATYTPPAGAVTYTLTWTISNGFCQKSDAMLLNIVSPILPVSAGSDITLSCNGSCVTMNGSNPGLAPPQGGLWTVISGPNTPVITNPTLRNTTVCNLVPGSYTLRWTVSGSCGSGSDDVIITVTNIFSPPVTQAAQSYTSFCGVPAVTTQVLTGTPLTAGETAVWTQTGGGTTATFSPNNTVANVTVGNLTGSFPYTFNYVRTNAAGCTSSSTHTVYRNADVLALTTPADVDLACEVTSTTFTLSYTNNATVTNGLTRAGVRISGPGAVGTVAFTSTAIAGSTRTDTWTATGMTLAGTYVFRMEYRNSCGSQFRDIAITVSRNPGAVNAGSDPLLPCNTLSANPIGSAAAPGIFTWTQVSGPNTAALAGVNTTSLTMTGLTQGVYTMRFSISGGKTCPSKSDLMLVKVTTAAPTTATTDADATICAGNVRLTGNTPGPLETGTWTVTPSAGVNFLPSANTPNAIASGLAANTAYTFRWTISNPCGSIFDEQILTTTNVEGPPLPNAGADVCLAAGTTTTNLNGNAPAGSTIVWIAVDAGSSVSPTNTQATTATFSGPGRYRFIYELSKTGCTSLQDTVVVNINQAITANAGADIDICAASLPATTTLTATAPPAGTTGIWSQLSGTATIVLSTPGSTSTLASGFQPGIYEFEYRISSGGICPDITDNVAVRVVSEPSAAVAGPDQSICDVTTATAVSLAATAPAIGSGYWQVVTGPPGSTPTFSNQLSASSTISNLMNGTYTLRWTTTNGAGCADKTDDVVINVTARANAKPDFNLCNATTANLDGNPNTTGSWSFVSGPAGSAITTNSPNTAVVDGLIAPGTYVFRYSLPAVGACAASSDDVTVINYPQPSQAIAPADAELCFNQTTTSLTGNVPAVGRGSWVRESGPNTPTAGAANTNSIDTTLNNLVAGLYVYRYEINTNAVCVASFDRVQIIKEVTANARPDIRVCNATTVNLNATPTLQNTGSWSTVSGPTGSTITNTTAPNTSVSGMVPGTYVFRWTVSSPPALGCAANTDDVQVIIDPAVPVMNAGTDIAFCEGSVSPFTIGSTAQPSVSYSWTPALLLSNAAIAQPDFNGVNNAGTYVYTVRGTIGACETFDQIEIKVNPKPVPVMSINSIGCTSVTFNGQNIIPGINSPTYSWNFGAGATPATATGAGPHNVVYPAGGGNKTATLTVTSLEGCSNVATQIINNTCYSLPITITKFTADWRDTYTELNWEVSAAVNFNRFEVERSYDGINYNSIATTQYNAPLTNYQYDDRNVSNGVNKIFYRLKLIDLDGRFSYSSIRIVFPSLNTTEVLISPNPFIEKIGVWINVSAVTEKITIKLISLNGQLIRENHAVVSRGNQYLEINNLDNLPAGGYAIQVQGEKSIITKKVIKQ